MTRSVRTSLAITFSSNLGSDVLQLEVDSRPDGLNAGRTQFYPGDTVYLLEYVTASVAILDRYSTDGGLVSLSTDSHTVTEFLVVDGARSVNTSKPVVGAVNILRWWGKPFVYKGVRGNVMSFASETVAVMEVTYTTNFNILRLTGASGEAPVLVRVIGEVN